jgi:hypothetical protein
VHGLILCEVITAAAGYFDEVAKMIRETGPAENAEGREGLAEAFA